jgi:hypothetical protein
MPIERRAGGVAGRREVADAQQAGRLTVTFITAQAVLEPFIFGSRKWFLTDSTGERDMPKGKGEIGVTQLTIEQLTAVSGGAVMSSDDALAFRNAMIEGFCAAGGSTSLNPKGGLDWHAGGHTVHT